jgi:hypothetical protein
MESGLIKLDDKQINDIFLVFYGNSYMAVFSAESEQGCCCLWANERAHGACACVP